jgi:zinc protease
VVLLAVGDRTRIEPRLKELGLGPVEVRDATGNLVKVSDEKAGSELHP